MGLTKNTVLMKPKSNTIAPSVGTVSRTRTRPSDTKIRSTSAAILGPARPSLDTIAHSTNQLTGLERPMHVATAVTSSPDQDVSLE